MTRQHTGDDPPGLLVEDEIVELRGYPGLVELGVGATGYVHPGVAVVLQPGATAYLAPGADVLDVPPGAVEGCWVTIARWRDYPCLPSAVAVVCDAPPPQAPDRRSPAVPGCAGGKPPAPGRTAAAPPVPAARR